VDWSYLQPQLRPALSHWLQAAARGTPGSHWRLNCVSCATAQLREPPRPMARPPWRSGRAGLWATLLADWSLRHAPRLHWSSGCAGGAARSQWMILQGRAAQRMHHLIGPQPKLRKDGTSEPIATKIREIMLHESQCKEADTEPAETSPIIA
jgi:hypothetical protein